MNEISQKNDWLEACGVEENQIPLSLITHGEWKNEEDFNLWKTSFKKRCGYLSGAL
ncbi:hypothetical protein [Jeotgalibacillus marinus]|uniref:Uncharacterized protein n=1 Tax=Jeotgalibacillus marinus TaxID=86667 RepID=A0ABV3Q5A8_9BACL